LTFHAHVAPPAFEVEVTSQLPLGLALRDSFRFTSYFAGRNAEVLAAVEALAVGERPTATWIHGGTSTGKSHLLQALCARASDRNERAAYLPLASVRDRGPEILAGCGDLAWVCLDDVDTVIGDRAWEHDLFALHGELDDRRAHLVLASRSPPAALRFALADLSSRMNGALVLKLVALDDEEMLQALRMRASARGLELSEDVAQLLLRRLPRELATLCDFLDVLDRESLAAQRRLSVPFVAGVLDRRTTQAQGGDQRDEPRE
jgi:DnaA family protein